MTNKQKKKRDKASRHGTVRPPLAVRTRPKRKEQINVEKQQEEKQERKEV